MFFSFNSAVRECKRMGKGYTITKKVYGWVVVDANEERERIINTLKRNNELLK